MFKHLKKLAVALSFTAPVLSAAHAADITLRFAHEAPETAIKGQSANKFAELVSEYTNGTVNVQVYPGGQLIPTNDEIRAVARGQIDIAAPYTSYFSSIDPAWDVLYQPLLFDNPEHAINTFAGSTGSELLERLSSRGMIGLGIWHDGPVYLFNNGSPIKTPEELQGRKVRLAPSRPLEAALESAGASPVSIPATEVYLALQQGVANSVVTTPTYVGPAKWDEVLTSGTKIMFGVGGYGFIANSNSLEKMNEEQQAGFMRAAQEATQWNSEQAMENIAHWEEVLADKGITWYEPTEEDLKKWEPVARAAEEAQSDEAREMLEQVRSNEDGK